MRFRVLLLAALALLLAQMVAAFGQNGGDAPPPLSLETVQQTLTDVDEALKRENLTDADLVRMRDRLDPIRTRLAEAAAVFGKEREAADRRLAEIGPPPAEGATEAPEITRERETQGAARQQVEATEKQARLLLVRADQAYETIVARRRSMFTAQVFGQSRSILEPALWSEAWAGVRRGWIGLVAATGRELAGAVSRLHATDYAVLLSALAAALLLLFPIGRRARELALMLVEARIADPHFRASAYAALAATFTAGCLFSAGVVIGLALDTTGLLPSILGQLAIRVLGLLAFVSVVHGLAIGLLSPENPSLRLAPFSDDVVQQLRYYPVALATVMAIGKAADAGNSLLGANLSVTILNSGIFALIDAAILAKLLRTLPAARSTGVDGERHFWLATYRVIGWLVVFAVPLMAAIGYVKLASFLIDQLVFVAIVGALLFLLLRLVDDAIMAWARPAGLVGRLATATVGFGAESLERLAVIASGVLRAGLIVIAALLVAAPWGLQSTNFFGAVRAAVFGFSVGGITISLGDILAAVLLFFVGFAATRIVQHWLERRLLPKTALDVGLRSSISTAIGYLGVIGAAVFAFAFLGLGLDRIAILAGALSVGIGFGLQSIVSNFVSGVILLAERPIKPGDWVAVGADEGNVQRIRVRATEIALFDGSTLLVPNADFVTKAVRNVTHRGTLGRVKLDFGIAHGMDVDRVKEVALGVANENRRVLRTPVPSLQLTGFRDAGMSFSLIAYVDSPRAVSETRSDLAFALVRACQAAGLEMK